MEPPVSEETRRKFQIAQKTFGGQRKFLDRKIVISTKVDRPVVIEPIGEKIHFSERIRKTRRPATSVNRILLPAESQTREDVAVEDRFHDGAQRMARIHQNRRTRYLKPRPIPLIDREDHAISTFANPFQNAQFQSAQMPN